MSMKQSFIGLAARRIEDESRLRAVLSLMLNQRVLTAISITDPLIVQEIKNPAGPFWLSRGVFCLTPVLS